EPLKAGDGLFARIVHRALRVVRQLEADGLLARVEDRARDLVALDALLELRESDLLLVLVPAHELRARQVYDEHDQDQWKKSGAEKSVHSRGSGITVAALLIRTFPRARFPYNGGGEDSRWFDWSFPTEARPKAVLPESASTSDALGARYTWFQVFPQNPPLRG